MVIQIQYIFAKIVSDLLPFVCICKLFGSGHSSTAQHLTTSLLSLQQTEIKQCMYL